MSTLIESWPRRHRITVDEYHRMAEVGLLAPDARVELIEGEIIDMAPIGPRHMSVVDRLNRLFVVAAGEGAIVRAGGSVRLGRMSEPQPPLRSRDQDSAVRAPRCARVLDRGPPARAVAGFRPARRRCLSTATRRRAARTHDARRHARTRSRPVGVVSLRRVLSTVAASIF